MRICSMSEQIRIYVTGECEGLAALRSSLTEHPEIEVVGTSEHVATATAVLAGGHLDCIIHATRATEFPGTEIAALREHSRAPVILVASGGEAAAMLEDALETDVADVLLLPQLLHNVVFAIRKAAHVRRSLQPARHDGRIVTVFSPKVGTGKTV